MISVEIWQIVGISMLSLERRGQLPEELQLSLKKHALPHFFEETVKLNPNNIALSSPEKTLSYSELNSQANSIAHHLLENNIQPRDRVAVYAEATTACVAAILGILKVGAVYVPLDPLSQKCQISSILNESHPKLLLSGTETVPGYLADELNTLIINDLTSEDDVSIEYKPEPQDPAHIVFTKKNQDLKGIEIPHQSVSNFSCWVRTSYKPHSIAALASRPRCESFVPELMSSLCNGATVKFLPGTHLQSVQDLKQWIYEESIDSIALPVTAAEELLEEPWSKHCPLKILFVSEGRLKKPPVNDLPFRVINRYGHPESGSISTEYEVKPDEESLIIPIGHPISNVKMYVLNSDFQEVTHGESGQFCLGGTGLATGYLNDELNHSHFVIHTRVGKRPERLFLTGDCVRKRADGKLEFLGQMENQEAIGDFQVGLSAVENIISSHVGILHVHVKPITIEEETVLAAYWVGKKNASISETNLKRALKRRLPPHMVPQHLIQLAGFPIGVDGKVCTEQLPIPHLEEEAEEERDLPTNPMGKKLVDLWESTLEIPAPGIHKSLFDLEISPALATKLHQSIQQHFGKEIPLSAFYQRDTVAKQAKWLTENESPSDEKIVTIESEGDGPALICLHGFVQSAYLYFRLAKALKQKIPMVSIDVTCEEATIEEIASQTVERIKKINPKGPYRILGEGVGGYLVYEVAKLLGSNVTFVGILDTWAPCHDEKPPLFKRLQINTNHFFHLTGDQKKQFMIQKLERLENRTSELFGFKKHNESQGELVPDAVWWAQRKAMNSYVPEPTEQELTIFRFQNDSDGDPSLGWKKLSNYLKIEKIPGSHETLYHKPTMKVFASKLIKLIP